MSNNSCGKIKSPNAGQNRKLLIKKELCKLFLFLPINTEPIDKYSLSFERIEIELIIYADV